jgi:hypothetical protein
VGQLDTFTATPGNTKKKFKIDRNTQKLMIVRSNSSSFSVGPSILGNLFEVVTVENTNSGNQRTNVADRVKLGYLACFAQYGEGVIPERIIAGDVTTRIPVVLGRDGYAVTGNDNFSILVENMQVGCTYAVFALETPTTGARYWEYLQSSILAGDHQKAVDVDAASAILLPSAAGISRATVTYATTDGDKTCDYTLEELQFINAEGNDIEVLAVSSADALPGTQAVTAAYGSSTSELLVIMLGPVKHIVFHTDGSLVDYVIVTERSRHVA